MSLIIATDAVFEGTDNWNDGAIVVRSDSSDDGVLLVMSDIVGATIQLDVFEQGNATAVYSTTVAKADVIDDVPVQWRLNSTGRNFAHQIRQADVGAGVLRGGRRYDFVYQIPTVNDGELRCVWVWQVKGLPV